MVVFRSCKRERKLSFLIFLAKKSLFRKNDKRRGLRLTPNRQERIPWEGRGHNSDFNRLIYLVIDYCIISTSS